METKKLNDLKVNDGNGLLDNEGLIDSLTVNCSDLVKALTTGQYVMFCSIVVNMVQKLSCLKEGIRNDIESREKCIADLQRLCDELTAQLENIGQKEQEG